MDKPFPKKAQRSAAFADLGAIFAVFLRLGLSSFGGPVAHLGYFRKEFVEKRRWLTDAAYAELVALSQFLPGPASSQTGFALGLMRGGYLGGFFAWLGFTLPSAVIMAGAAYGLAYADGPEASGLIAGLKLVAVAVVAQAVLGMWRSLCPDVPRGTIAVLALAVLLSVSTAMAQLGVIAVGAAIGFLLLRDQGGRETAPLAGPVSARAGAVLLTIFFALLLLLPVGAALWGGLELADAFYRAGALVFGGGHVVLPLLQEATVVPGWIGPDDFLAGYGVAQALPGPLFAFAAYLGAVSGTEPNGIAGAFVALIAIFLPGLLLVMGALPFWDRLRAQPKIRSAIAGANAAVVGVLAAALYNPIFLAAVTDGMSLAIAVLAFAALVLWRLPVLLVVVLTAGAGLARAIIGI
jgi:chromate transporter